MTPPDLRDKLRNAITKPFAERAGGCFTPDVECNGPDTNCPCEADASASLAAITSALTAAGIPLDRLISGEWVAVPKEPTQVMVNAGHKHQTSKAIYRAMIRARLAAVEAPHD